MATLEIIRAGGSRQTWEKISATGALYVLAQYNIVGWKYASTKQTIMHNFWRE